MNFWRYKYFVDVVEQHSFTKAGKLNYVSQTAISQQIAALEKEVGGKLINRGNGSTEMTSLGSIVYRNAKNILEAEENMQKELEVYMNRYTVHIGIDSSVNRIIWEIMQEMIDSYYCEGMFKFVAVSGSSAEELLSDGSLDIMIGYKVSSGKSMDIRTREICRSDVGVYVGRRCDLYDREGVMMSELKEYPRYYSSDYSVSKWHLPEAGGTNVSNVETMKVCTEFNRGYSLVDSRLFSGTDGKVLELRGEKPQAILKMFYRNDHYIPVFGEIAQHARELIEKYPKGIGIGTGL